MPHHFGLIVREGKKGLKLTRDKYATINNKSSFSGKLISPNYADEEGNLYTDEWCANHKKQCLENYDLNMLYYKALDKVEFNNELAAFLNRYQEFIEVFDLNLYDNKNGYYILVLDQYRQIYIGTTNNIKKRVRQHWSNSRSFDRLLFPIGAVNTSRLSIDSFRALDTTRIYASVTSDTYNNEDSYINQFSDKFITNRIGGGRVNSLLQVIATIKKRQLE